MRMHFGMIALVLCTFGRIAFADTLGAIQQKLREREEKLRDTCFVYALDYTIAWHGQEAHSYTHRGGAFIISLCRSTAGITKIAFSSKVNTNNKILKKKIRK